MLDIYKTISRLSKPALIALLMRRKAIGKEIPERIAERKGRPSKDRPEGKLFWVHAASVGEVQSALVLIRAVLNAYPDAQCLVTTGTVTSAALMEGKMPDRTLHQFYPLDHPKWTNSFLDYWRPDLCLWMESELWPNMLMGIQKRKIPAALINARLSPRSFRKWQKVKSSIRRLLQTFDMVLTQTEKDAEHFTALGAHDVLVSDNLKYSAKPLGYEEHDYNALARAIAGRTLITYASTHKGEEELAAQVHEALKGKYPDLLTIIVPRHPDRGQDIARICDTHALDPVLRREAKRLPDRDTDVYIVNTIGEMGLIYDLVPFTFIGRSFSDDGGGGHNPLEPALLNCAVLHGPHVQNLQDIFDNMDAAGAAMKIESKNLMIGAIGALLDDEASLSALQMKAREFATHKARVINKVMDALEPHLDAALSP